MMICHGRKSIMCEWFDKCYLCGQDASEIHHVFGGANRNNSEQYGLVVPLCRKCHSELHFGKNSRAMMDHLRAEAQEKFENTYKDLDFMSIFHRNWR